MSDDSLSLVTGQNWYVVATEPGHEYLARRWIDASIEPEEWKHPRLGFTTFLPEIEVTRRLAHGRSIVAKGPYLPGYLFVAFDPARDPWGAINDCVGVVRVLTASSDALDGKPQPIKRGFIEQLQDATVLGGGVIRVEVTASGMRFLAPPAPKERKTRGLCAGQRLRVKDGPLAGEVGRFDLYLARESDRIQLMLDAMGGAVALVISEALVEPIADDAA